MKNTHLITALLVVSAIVVPIAVLTASSKADSEPMVVVAPVVSAAPPTPEPEPIVPVDDGANARHEALRSYTLAVMNGWQHAVSTMPVADYGDVASDIATAVQTSPDAKAPGWQTDHARVVVLAALGYWEGARYAAYVDELKCNDPAWRATAEGQRLMHLGGDCDHKNAHSLWQIHPIDDPASSLYALCNTKMIDNSRVDAARCALELATRSLRSTDTLTNYTGEWSFEHPKADVRLDFATRALAKHP